MSIRIMALAWDIHLPASDKLVLLALADCANDEGVCWPSMATLVRKCSKGERTVQGSIKNLVASGQMSRIENPGKGCLYTIHPRRNCAPMADVSGELPPQELRPAEAAPAQKLPLTPAESADKPSRTIISKNTQCAHGIPGDWKPVRFADPKSKSQAVVDGWPPGELETQIEHFTAHHRGKGTRFKNWQDAWSTWVLNSRRFGGSNAGSHQTRGRTTQNRPIDGAIACLDRELFGNHADGGG